MFLAPHKKAGQHDPAREATERDVTLRTSEPIWIRVADEKRGHMFEYSFSR
ncbi:hypothetical protein X735_15175 [Mesorhizobium sp. L2C085B000]|uniref:hypothetical protein n=1 Tax=unclassified Mesorhizobium TaxID=325217 RepID=UPI0003CFFC27|nr:hypothetical protein [Mesorhizobium sp. L2C085B000]ESZ14936.1 hypothetical protein X735_15175 [Mesorhizobium sp. L2C085B000]